MSDARAWWRTGAGIAAWLVLAVTTAGIAWAAVAVVADQGDDPASVAVPDTAPTTSTRTPSASAGSSADSSTDPQDSGGGVRLISSPGGTVSVTCTGVRTIQKLSVTPAVGWLIAEDRSGPDEVRVEFARGEHGGDDYRIRARCEGGIVDSESD